MKFSIRKIIGWFVFGFTVSLANGSIASADGAAAPAPAAADVSKLKVNVQLTAPWGVDRIYVQGGSQVMDPNDLQQGKPLCVIYLATAEEPTLRAIYPDRKFSIDPSQSKPDENGWLHYGFSGEPKVLGMACTSGRSGSPTPSLDEVKLALGSAATASTRKPDLHLATAARVASALHALNQAPAGSSAVVASNRKLSGGTSATLLVAEKSAQSASAALPTNH